MDTDRAIVYLDPHKYAESRLTRSLAIDLRPKGSCDIDRTDGSPALPKHPIDNEVRHSSTSLERTVSELKVSIAAVLSKWIVTLLNEAASRSRKSTATLIALA